MQNPDPWDFHVQRKAMKILHLLTAIISIALVTSCATPNAMKSKLSPKIKVERFLQKAIAEEHFSGVIMVVREGEVILNQGYGMATEKDENKPDTVIHVASVTKQFTAAAIMLLNEAGKIDLAVSINHYLPKKYQSDKWKSVTVHHLLSHTGGVSDYAEQRPYYDVRKGFCFGSTVDGMIHEAQAKDLEFVPGSEFRYSNIGYTLLGVIIEQVSGHPYGEFIKQELLIPAKMFLSGIHEESYRWKQGEAKGYRWDEGQQKFVEDDVI
ncbi:MAG: serine hydrolase domain-containing protein, partial [Minisyncoccia bacterium]